MKPKTHRNWRADVRTFYLNLPVPPEPPEPEEDAEYAKQHQIQSAFKKTLSDYCHESTVQGVTYLHAGRGFGENLFWALAILTFFIICIGLAKTQYDRWQYAPVIISFSEKPTAVSLVPFPAITICSETKYNRTDTFDFEKFYNYLKDQGDNVIEPPDWLTEDEYMRMRALLQVCGDYLSRGINFPEYVPNVIIDSLNEIAPSFEKNFIFCEFNRTTSNCTPHFDKVYTQQGICYSFNAFNVTELYREDTFQYKYFLKDTHIRKRNDSLDWTIDKGYKDPNDYTTYPERVVGSGLGTGLIVVLQEFENALDPVCREPVQGFKVTLHAPDIIPLVDKDFIHIPYERDVLISVTPHFVYTTEIVDHYKPEDRKCYLPHERPLRFFSSYSQTSCEVECLTNFTLRICGCVQFAMPRLVDTKVCGESKIRCYEDAEDNFLLNEYTGLGNANRRCNCLPGCYKLKYIPEVSQGTLHINKVIAAMEETVDIIPTGTNISRLRIHFRMNEFTAWKRSEVYGYGEFMASCGGLFGLFMGISLLSIVELFYHFTYRFYDNVKEVKRQHNN